MNHTARERSTALRLLGGFGRRLRRALDRSSLVAGSSEFASRIRPTHPESSTRASTVLERAAVLSAFGTAVAFAAAGLRRARSRSPNSRAVDAWSVAVRWATSSFWYRRLTDDARRNVVVIDVRDALILGALLETRKRIEESRTSGAATSTVTAVSSDVVSAARERPVRAASFVVFAVAAASFLPYARSAPPSAPFVALHLSTCVLAAVGLRSRRTAGEVLDTRFARTVIAAFEPLEPPGDVDDVARRSDESVADGGGDRKST